MPSRFKLDCKVNNLRKEKSMMLVEEAGIARMEVADRSSATNLGSDSYRKIDLISDKRGVGHSYFFGMIHLTQHEFFQFITILELVFIAFTIIKMIHFNNLHLKIKRK